jgi:hypothetical protein
MFILVFLDAQGPTVSSGMELEKGKKLLLLKLGKVSFN